MCFQHHVEQAPMIVIKSYKKNLINIPQILEEQKPRWVIIYDAEMTLVRQLEVYQRNNPSILVKIYFLVFGGTVEEQSYLTSLRQEKEAFDFLISEKAVSSLYILFIIFTQKFAKIFCSKFKFLRGLLYQLMPMTFRNYVKKVLTQKF